MGKESHWIKRETQKSLRVLKREKDQKRFSFFPWEIERESKWSSKSICKGEAHLLLEGLARKLREGNKGTIPKKETSIYYNRRVVLYGHYSRKPAAHISRNQPTKRWPYSQTQISREGTLHLLQNLMLYFISLYSINWARFPRSLLVRVSRRSLYGWKLIFWVYFAEDCHLGQRRDKL